MNKVLSTKLFVSLALLALVFASCVNKKQNPDEDGIDSLTVKQYDLQTKYKLPSPVELYLFMNEKGKKFDQSLLNPVERKEKYNTSVSKAINFGIYASDLAYCVVNEKTQETFKYFKVAKSLADELALAEGYDEEVVKRIESNLENADSLFEITSDAYWDACSHLESQGKSDMLAFITVGSWVESAYILTQSIKKYNPNDELVKRVVEQKLLLENLIDYINTLEKDEYITKVERKLLQLQESFNKFYDESGTMVVSEPVYEEVSKKIKSLRSAFVY